MQHVLVAEGMGLQFMVVRADKTSLVRFEMNDGQERGRCVRLQGLFWTCLVISLQADACSFAWI